MNGSIKNSSDLSGFQEEIGGVLYILKYLSIYIPYGSFALIGIVLGFVGNIFISGAILTSHELRNNATFILIFNLALADFCISVFVDSFKIFGMLIGKKFFDDQSILCSFIGSACIVSCMTSLLTMGFLALNRLISIIFITKARLFTKKVSIGLSFLAWAIAICLTLPNYFGFGDFVYDKKILSCASNRLKIGYTLMFSILFIIIPCCLIAICYLFIFVYVFRSKKHLKHSNNKSAQSHSYQESIKIAKSLFASFFLFAICWIPAGLIFIFDFDDKLPISAHTFTILPAHLNSAINPIFYGIFNPKMKKGYLKFLNLFFCKKLTCSLLVDSTRNSGIVETTKNRKN